MYAERVMKNKAVKVFDLAGARHKSRKRVRQIVGSRVRPKSPHRLGGCFGGPGINRNYSKTHSTKQCRPGKKETYSSGPGKRDVRHHLCTRLLLYAARK